MIPSSIWATVVLYYPDEKTIAYLNRLSSWIRLVIVDNTPHAHDFSQGKAHYIALNENTGVASALNLGMKHALSCGAQWCLLLDQDSRLTRDDVMVLTQELAECRHDELAILAPTYYCNNVERYGDVILFDGTYKRSQVSLDKKQRQRYLASYVISSGSLVNLKVCEKIGWHDESLFIDFVDIEWGLRARSGGYDIYLTNQVCMQHSIGDRPVNCGRIKWVNHSPIRHYYYFRNVFLMLRKPHVPRQWKLRELVKLAPRFLIYACLTQDKWSHTKYMLKGVLHGILGRSGPFR